jgi:tryptophanyl-tRNA synthetase
METVVSGIRSTGKLHLGNFYGAVKNFVQMQHEYNCYFFIADYHSLTTHPTPEDLHSNVKQVLVEYLAAGIDPDKATIYVQSDVPEIAELYLYLNMNAYMGELERSTSFKDKVRAQPDNVNAGLLTYPVLMAADILIHKATKVPVGKDQEQHLELTRDIAHRFNTQVNKEYFVLPEPLYTDTPKIRSTADPERKMSKSAGEKHYINVFADEATLRRQIKSAVTDSGDTPQGAMAEGVQNLFELIRASGWQDAHDALMDDYNAGKLKYVDLKQATADALVSLTQKFIERKKEIQVDKKRLKDQVKQSSSDIRKVAQQTLREVKELVGLLNV